ncbi:dynamin family protein [Aulosira sp. FACHB-615]|uniref:dynamin family protein n=1 Tax=Aulosira sp. FACHB-615 TaxID=2692777 RepID=UPI0016893EDA|nr:dynamin family protein [Aulosira sp. FACHB-615]MBD2487193.1 dynamin family protein [Aulosira sp. FACHB-615]
MFDDIFSTLQKKTSEFIADSEQNETEENLPPLALNIQADEEDIEINSNTQFEAKNNSTTQSEELFSSETSDNNEQTSSQQQEPYQLISPRTLNKMTNVDEHIEFWIESCLKLAETISCHEIMTALTELDVRWEFPGFRLAFVGEFSRGKSTLINRLLERDLLPVGAMPTTGTLISIVPGTTEKMEVRTPDQGWVVRPIEESSWNDLLATEENKDNQEQLTHVRLTLDDPWLRTIDVELIDTPGAGDLNSNRTALLCDLLSQCDAAVILVSATLPFSITEATFLEQEVLGKHIPNVLVAVSKFDTVAQEQKFELLQVIRDRIKEVSTKVPIIPIHPLNPDGSEIDALAKVRTHIESMVEKGERRIWRSRKVAGQLIDYLNQMVDLSEAAIKSVQMSVAEKEQALRQAQQERANTELYWEDIRLNLDDRRLQHTQRLKQKVLQAKEELTEVYSFELKKVKDLKSWWERDLPFQLRRELLILGNQLSEEIFNELSQDFEWMQKEVAQKFSRQLVRNSSDSSSTVNVDLRLSQLELTDIRHYALLTGLASSATTICGYIFGGPGGVVISTVAWVLSDQFINQKTDEQRQRLSEELVLNIERITDDYFHRLSERLRELYNQLIAEIKNEQKVWQSAWESTLKKSTNIQDISHYTQLIEQASQLKQEIRTVLSH